MPQTLFFSVGEPSGDLHGANLISTLREATPQIKCVGFGGPKMAKAGCDLHHDLTKLAVMWILRVIANLPTFVGLLVQADRYFRTQRPDAVILIDYPGFNWWIARRAKAHHIPVFYYGTPQLWAWAPWRVKKMRRLVDHILCKLPFEETWFRDRNCNATFVGHPYFDELEKQSIDQKFVDEQKNHKGALLTILPGSRNQEVEANLPAMLEVAQKVRQQIPSIRLAIASYSIHQAIKARELSHDCGFELEIRVNSTPELVAAADVCLACSGSVSLELLYHAKPTIIYYQISPWAFWLQDKIRIARYITLTNLLASDNILRKPGEFYDPDAPDAESIPMPEYLVCEDRSTPIARRIVRWLEDDDLRSRKTEELIELRERFAGPGASHHAADYIINALGRSQSSCKMPSRKSA